MFGASIALQAVSWCHSDPATAGEESRIDFGPIPNGVGEDIKKSSRSPTLIASPLGEGERIEVRGPIARRAATAFDATLTLTLSLAKGEAPHVIPVPHATLTCCKTST